MRQFFNGRVASYSTCFISSDSLNLFSLNKASFAPRNLAFSSRSMSCSVFIFSFSSRSLSRSLVRDSIVCCDFFTPANLKIAHVQSVVKINIDSIYGIEKTFMCGHMILWVFTRIQTKIAPKTEPNAPKMIIPGMVVFSQSLTVVWFFAKSIRYLPLPDSRRRSEQCSEPYSHSTSCPLFQFTSSALVRGLPSPHVPVTGSPFL